MHARPIILPPRPTPARPRGPATASAAGLLVRGPVASLPRPCALVAPKRACGAPPPPAAWARMSAMRLPLFLFPNSSPCSVRCSARPRPSPTAHANPMGRNPAPPHPTPLPFSLSITPFPSPFLHLMPNRLPWSLPAWPAAMARPRCSRLLPGVAARAEPCVPALCAALRLWSCCPGVASCALGVASCAPGAAACARDVWPTLLAAYAVPSRSARGRRAHGLPANRSRVTSAQPHVHPA
jgi:hypothetical protein